MVYWRGDAFIDAANIDLLVPYESMEGMKLSETWGDLLQKGLNGETIVGINPSNGDRELEEKNDFIKLVYPKDGASPYAAIQNITNKDLLVKKNTKRTSISERPEALAARDESGHCEMDTS